MQTITFKQDRRPAGALKPTEVYQNEVINYSYYTGTVETYYAMVLVTAMRTIYKKEVKPPVEHMIIRFIYNGTNYMRTFKKFYSPRYAATLANRFVNEVIGKPEVKAKAKPKTRQRQRQLPFQR